jgi:dTDP-glucose 4,6-dehydratase
VLTRSPDRFREKAPHVCGNRAISLVPGDVKTFKFPSGRFSSVIHAAAESSTIHEDHGPLAMFDTIMQGTRRVLDLALQTGAKRFLLLSSGAVYGMQPPRFANLPETYGGAPSPAEPVAAYGEAKRVAELLCACYRQRGDCEMKIARCFAFVGPHIPLDGHFAIGNFIRDALQGGPINVKGDGEPERSYLYAADLAIWLWTILLRGGDCRPYNVGSENAVTIGTLAQLVADTLRPGTKVSIAQPQVPGSRPLHYVPSTQRAREDLGLTEHVALSEAIRRTAEWYSMGGTIPYRVQRRMGQMGRTGSKATKIRSSRVQELKSTRGG